VRAEPPLLIAPLREKVLDMNLVEACGLTPEEFPRIQKVIVMLRNNLVKAVHEGE
jgi:hypothetical protein